jgi:hypothetical protein
MTRQMPMIAVPYSRLRLRLEVDRPQRHPGGAVLSAEPSAGVELRLIDRA